MHELSLMADLVSAVGERVGGARVLAVRLEVGRLAGVLPDALRFCFEVAAQGSSLEGASLAIEEINGCARCRSCGAGLELSSFGPCGCGSLDLEVIAGQELRIREVEVL